MGKRKDKRRGERLYRSLVENSAEPESGEGSTDVRPSSAAHGDAPVPDEVLASSEELSRLLPQHEGTRRRMLPLMKKFRFQLLHRWMTEHLQPGRVADVGGGKGLLAYLLRRSGWDATVIDPVNQPLPAKYKDLDSDRQVRISPEESIARVTREFERPLARDFDLLVAMHAHGCNIELIDSAAEYGRSLILLPCCIINEPLYPPPGVHWLQSVVDYATRKGLAVEPFRLNFKGQNVGLYITPRLERAEPAADGPDD